MPSYQVSIGERVVRVDLRRDGERTWVRTDDGEEREVELATVRGALRTLVLGGRRLDVLAARDQDEVSLSLEGLEYQASVVDELRARLAQLAGGRATAHARRELKAPMPGLIVRVGCGVGDTVEAGQPLVVLQAMKMENELALPRGGTVVSVSAEAGQTVEQGQVLVVLE